MDNKQNLHVHSTYCDGKDTPEAIILEAIDKGFDSLGFSIHSYHSSSNSQIVTMEKIEAYKKEILRLKQEYAGKFDVFLGIEYEIVSEHSYQEYEYVIASVHYLETEYGIKGFDVGLQATLDYIQKYFGGNGMRFARKYYETVASIPERGDFDVIGHFDLLTKNNEKGRFLDESSKQYLDLAFGAIDALKGKIDIFEVNTGAIARGYRTTPYPNMEILREFRRQGFGAIITSDCHNKLDLDCYYEEAEEMLREAGFRSKLIFTKEGFREVGI